MNKIKGSIGVVVFASLFFSASASAGIMVCGMHNITDGGRSGPGKYEVLKKCGEPTGRYGNTWVYDKPGRSKKVLIFDDRGLLIDIQG